MLQSGIPVVNKHVRQPANRLTRGVVVAVYVTDDTHHPYADMNPTAIYCDVLCYNFGNGSKAVLIRNALVAGDTGMQNGRIWKPRAATFDVTDPSNPVDPNKATNPANLDGDHVMLGFFDDGSNQAVVLCRIPHPSSDIGNAGHTVGHRMKLKLADGDPEFIKHHGTYYGVTDTADYVVDTTMANDGTCQNDGSEQTPPNDGSVGNHLYNLEQHCKRLLSLMDMSQPDSPNAVLTELLNMNGYILDFLNLTPSWQLQNSDGNALNVQGVGSDATMAVGDGTQHVPIVQRLQDFYTALQQKLTAFDAHTHPTAMGPSGPPTPTISAADWDTSINSTKISIPDG